MKIGIMGGTFDPIHNGHLEMMRQAGELLGLDLVYVIPAGNPYFKKGISPYKIRYEMTQLAIETLEDPRFLISDLEADEGKPTYTWQTLEIIHGQHPDAELYFLCGADVLAGIHSWRYPEKILQLASLAAFARKEEPENAKEQEVKEEQAPIYTKIESGLNRLKTLRSRLYQQFPDARCILLEAKIPDISSTMVRQRVLEGRPIHDLVPGPVEARIQKEHLYI